MTVRTCVAGLHEFQSIAIGELTGWRQSSTELSDELGADLQKVKSPFFRSIS